MGHSLRTKIMTGVITLLVLFAGALATTLYLVKDSDEEVGGILQYHLPILTRLNALDVVTYEIEIVAHRLADEGTPSKQRIEEILARTKKCQEQIDAIFKEAKALSEAGSKDDRNDLEDRLEMARMVGEIDSLKSEVDRFSQAAALPVELMAQGKGEEARKALGNLRNFEYLDPVITSLREKANRLTTDSLNETHGNIFNIIWTNAVLFLSASILGFLVFLLITGRLQKAFRGLIRAFHETADGKYSSPLPVTSEDEIGELTTSFNTMVEQLKSKEKLRDSFGQFLDPRIVANVINPVTGELRQSAERRKVTIFFSDIAGFSGIGEQLTADTMVRLLNRYFTAATEIVRRNHGIVDKFIGDAVMAFWASPFSEGEAHARDACLACLEMRTAFAEIAKEISDITGLRRNLPKFHVRMALATGDTVIGTVGSNTTKSFTVIGDTVNIASRLEGVNKIYGTDLIVNEDCFQLAEREVEAREIDLVTVYGKTEPVRIYELLGKVGELDGSTLQLRDTFATALQNYRQQKWDEAEKGFKACLKIRENDGPSLEFITRIATFSRTPPPRDWNGVWQTASK
ncbi:MAG: HAMP domain-containing protein [Verrucomicrobia bacterium]|nr:HAMP domain-containing protein [Verrucomicrobiota bacterium]